MPNENPSINKVRRLLRNALICSALNALVLSNSEEKFQIQIPKNSQQINVLLPEFTSHIIYQSNWDHISIHCALDKNWPPTNDRVEVE